MVSISREAETSIGRILQDVRRSSSTGELGQTSQASLVSARSVSYPGPSDCQEMESMDVVDTVTDVRSDCVGGASCDGVRDVMVCGPTPVDEQLREDLLEQRKSSSKYRQMMVSLLLSTYVGTSPTHAHTFTS